MPGQREPHCRGDDLSVLGVKNDAQGSAQKKERPNFSGVSSDEALGPWRQKHLVHGSAARSPPYGWASLAITAVTLAAMVMTIPIFTQVSAKLRFTMEVASNKNPQPSQEATEPMLIFLQLGHCLDMIHPLRWAESPGTILRDPGINFKDLLR
jgi:hypothetical protein